MGYAIGRLIGTLLVPVLLLLLIGLIYYWRTRDRSQAIRVMLSWWALALAFICLFLGMLGQAIQRMP